LADKIELCGIFTFKETNMKKYLFILLVVMVSCQKEPEPYYVDLRQIYIHYKIPAGEKWAEPFYELQKDYDTLRTRVAFGYQIGQAGAGYNSFGDWFESFNTGNRVAFVWTVNDGRIVLGWRGTENGKQISEVLCEIRPEVYYWFEIIRGNGVRFTVQEQGADTLLAEAQTGLNVRPDRCLPPCLESDAGLDMFLLIEYGR